jgi:hypothetical protein
MNTSDDLRESGSFLDVRVKRRGLREWVLAKRVLKGCFRVK